MDNILFAIIMNVCLLFRKPMLKLFLRLPERKAKWNIYKPESDKHKTCLSVCYFGILSVNRKKCIVGIVEI